jgi:hypothetical protein
VANLAALAQCPPAVAPPVWGHKRGDPYASTGCVLVPLRPVQDVLEGDRRFGASGAISQWINASFKADEGTAPLWRPGSPRRFQPGVTRPLASTGGGR